MEMVNGNKVMLTTGRIITIMLNAGMDMDVSRLIGTTIPLRGCGSDSEKRVEDYSEEGMEY
jgi:hypothetical protein